MTANKLFYGDNLDILRNVDYFPDECVDLIYLDPPFNSSRNYNVLFADESGSDSEAQITAFKDTWHWGETAEDTYYDLIEEAPHGVDTAIDAMMTLIGRNQMMAYLVMMAARLVELHRVLKPTGSLYLHCDPTASHYLKIILDAVFGKRNFRSEIVWKRTTTHSDSKSWAAVSDRILYYVKSNDFAWNTQYGPYDPEYIETKYRHDDEDGRGLYRLDNMTSPNPRPNLMYEWQGFPYPPKGWRYSKSTMQELHDEGRIYYPDSKDKRPQLKRYLSDMPGRVLDDVWRDINPINSQAAERLGYPTQKPVELLERIIRASSNEGDVVLDPFCGCGTTISAAQRLGRTWCGIDITHLAINLQKFRLRNEFDLEPGDDYDVIGEPMTVEAARELAEDDANDGRYQFQFWALSLVQGKPVGGEKGSRKGKRGKDRGIDGIVNFYDMKPNQRKPRPKKVLVQVKSGHVGSRDIRDLVGTVKREKAAMGVFITLQPPTADMTKEALSAGYYESPMWDEKYRKVQILTIEQLLNGAHIDMPPQSMIAFKAAKRIKENQADQRKLI